ncbi:MAG: TIGR00366 family protein [Gammaproteobacteria bacterium]
MALLERFSHAGERASEVAERYIPEAWVVCMMLTVVAFALAILGAGAGVEESVLAWGHGMWGFLSITMQFSISILAAYACVMSPLGFRAFDKLASLPNPDKPLQAVLLMAIVTTLTGYLNWALCFVVSAMFIPFLARRNPNSDVRVISAAAFMGAGTVTNAGLSGSAALIVATPGNPLVNPAVGEPSLNRLIPITETIFSSFNIVVIAVISVVSIVGVVLLHPRPGMRVVTFDAERLDRILPTPPQLSEPRQSPAGWLENQRFWCYLAGVLMLYTLGHSIVTKGFGASWNINAYNAVFLGGAMLLHGNPLSLTASVRRGLDAAWGIILQFPFYAAISGLLTGTALGKWLGGLFVAFSSQQLFPLVVYVYSAMMNLFIPSAGSKWMVEAPYLLDAARTLGVSDVTVTMAYIYGDTLTNLIHPYMAIPILAITGLKFADFAGYAFMVGVLLAVVMTGAMLLIPLNM